MSGRLIEQVTASLNLNDVTLTDRLSLSGCEGEQSDAGPFKMQAGRIVLPFWKPRVWRQVVARD
jgi:hypothetical protein